jgi:predicted DNA-binding protein (MmcQ/YjbR family)
MVTIDKMREISLSFPEATESPHFDKTSFRVKNKIFATYDDKSNRASLKLSETDQDVFSTIDKLNIYPVDNKWGKQGWTIVELSNIDEDIFIDVLTSAYYEVAPKSLGILVRPLNE